MTHEELKEYLVNECEYSQTEVEKMTPRQLVDAWLQCEGILGYTGQIIGLIKAAYQIEL